MQWRVLGLFLVVAALLLYLSAYTVQQDQRAMLFRFGVIEKSDIKPGLHFKWPLVGTVQKFDSRLLALNPQPTRFITSGKKAVMVDFLVKWRIENLDRYYRSTRGDEDQARTRLSQIVKDDLRSAIGQRTIQETVSGELNAITHAVTVESNKTAGQLGVKVENVRIVSIGLPSSAAGSVYKRMEADRVRIAAELRAQGKEAANQIRVNAEQQRATIQANAYRQAQTIRGQGDAEAAQIYAKAYGQDPDFYAFYRSLEAYRQSFGNQGNVLVLEPNSHFFRFFNQAEVAGKR